MSTPQSHSREVAQAVAGRRRGRRRLAAATAAISVASVSTAGAVAITLPGPASATAGDGSSSTGGTARPGGSGDAVINWGNFSDSDNLQAPAAPPTVAPHPTSRPVTTSGGTH